MYNKKLFLTGFIFASLLILAAPHPAFAILTDFANQMTNSFRAETRAIPTSTSVSQSARTSHSQTQISNVNSGTTSNSAAQTGQRNNANQSEQTANKDTQSLSDTLDNFSDAITVGATGIGGSMMAAGIAEQNQDELAKLKAAGNISTIKCGYGSVQDIAIDTMGISLDNGNALIDLYGEYQTIANRVKNSKESLGMLPGIESEVVFDKANSGLYDNTGSGAINKSFAAASESVRNPTGQNAEQFQSQQDESAKQKTTGMVVGGAGLLFGATSDVLIDQFIKK